MSQNDSMRGSLLSVFLLFFSVKLYIPSLSLVNESSSMKTPNLLPVPLSAVASDLIWLFSDYNPKSTSSNMKAKLSSIRDVKVTAPDSWGITVRHYHYLLVFEYGGIKYHVDYYPYDLVKKKRRANPFTGARPWVSRLLRPRAHYLPLTVGVNTGSLPVSYYSVSPTRHPSPAVALSELGTFSTGMLERSKGAFSAELLLQRDPGTIPGLSEQEHMVALLGFVLLFFDYA